MIVRVDPRYFRPTEVETLLGDATKAKRKLGWTPTTTLAELVREMVDSDYVAAKRDSLVKRPDSKPSTITNDRRQTALILGIGGQDAAYLARLLLSKGYKVFGTSRDATLANRVGLTNAGHRRQVQIVSMAPNDFRSVLQTLRRHQPRRDLQPGRAIVGGPVVRAAGRDDREHRHRHA